LKNKLEEIFKSKTKTISLIVAILVSVSILLNVYLEYNETGQVDTNKISEAISTVVDEINKSSTEIPNLTETDEQSLEVQETESEGFEEQGIIAYEGSEKTPNVQVGEYAGLTYYSQLDSRWSNKMYSSIENKSQTIGSSGCGPTSAAMVVSSIKGNITPDTMAELYTKYSYRSANQGTYWSAFKWTADIFDIGYSECYKLDDAVTKLKDNNYIIASCNQGLFTYGGHFIVLIGVEGDYIKVYDPYLYNGKFDVSSRRGLATVNGNTVYVSIENFREYANYQKFFCFKNNRTDTKENTTTTTVTDKVESNINKVNYQVKVIANGGLNIRSGASTSYSRVGGYAKGSIVTVLAESNNFGKTNLGWISLAYTTRYTAVVKNETAQKYTTGTYRVNANILNVRTGPSTKYKIKSYKQLTANARYQNKKLGNQYTNGLKRGVITTVTKIQNGFGLTPSGWMALGYCTKM
jgi:hypothetical protein